MKEIDFNSELSSLLKYYESLIFGQTDLGADMEEITKDIINKKESGEALTVNDFISLEQASFKTNLYYQDSLKCAAVIKELYRISLNAGVKTEFSDTHNRILHDIINNPAFGFAFYSDNHGIHFKDTEFEDNIRQICASHVDPSTLEDRYQDLKLQYENYLNIKNKMENGSKKADE